MKKCINPQAIEIQERFFEALDWAISSNNLKGLKTFCEEHNLNRTKYSKIRSEMRNMGEPKPRNYKIIDLDALTYLCRDFNISPDWLLLNKGGMFRK